MALGSGSGRDCGYTKAGCGSGLEVLPRCWCRTSTLLVRGFHAASAGLRYKAEFQAMGVGHGCRL